MWTFLATFVILVHTIIADAHYALSDEFIDKINSMQNLWKAGRNFPANTPYEIVKLQAGTFPSKSLSDVPIMEHDPELIATLPENFDPRDKWPDCPTLNEIRDQGACGSCFAFGTAAAMTDRYCIHSNGKQHFHFSSQDIMTCCPFCGISCEGGNSESVWDHWNLVGIVSGGAYGSKQGCQPYLIPPCEHHNATGNLPPCGRNSDDMYCYETCQPDYNVEYKQDRRFGQPKYSLPSDENQIKAELFTNGPVSASIVLYEDYLHYKSGVYVHTIGKVVGHHTIKLMGYGIENGTKYWLLANSYNSDWGDNGFIKILRGTNHCSVENGTLAAIPIIPKIS